MLLGGLWHGAAWTFVAWGALHGLYLSVHKIVLAETQPRAGWPTTAAGWLRDATKIFVTFHLVAATWLLFRADDFSSALSYAGGILQFEKITDVSTTVVIAILLVALLDVVQTWSKSHTWLAETKIPRLLRYATVELLVICVLAAAIYHVDTITPFIYFQF